MANGTTAKESLEEASAERNMQIWNKVSVTNPQFTTPFTIPGGFSGTAINATYQMERATELFGPCGIGWGVDVVDEQIIEGKPLGVFGETGMLVMEKIHTLRIKLWYVHGQKKGEVYAFGHTHVVTSDRNGFKTVLDYAKMSLTDATSKALQCLGFSADVYLKLFGDNKYVRAAEQATAGDVPSSVAQVQHPVGAGGAGGNPQPSQSAVGGNGRPAQVTQGPQQGQTWTRLTVPQIKAMTEEQIAGAVAFEIKSRLGIEPMTEGKAIAMHRYGASEFIAMSLDHKRDFLFALNDAPNKGILLRDVPAALLNEMRRQEAERKKQTVKK